MHTWYRCGDKENKQLYKHCVMEQKIVRDTVVHVLTEERKRDREGENRGNRPINSTLVMRGERKGHRDAERRKSHSKNEPPSLSMFRSHPQK